MCYRNFGRKEAEGFGLFDLSYLLFMTYTFFVLMVFSRVGCCMKYVCIKIRYN
jgi:hypothetical protein